MIGEERIRRVYQTQVHRISSGNAGFYLTRNTNCVQIQSIFSPILGLREPLNGPEASPVFLYYWSTFWSEQSIWLGPVRMVEPPRPLKLGANGEFPDVEASPSLDSFVMPVDVDDRPQALVVGNVQSFGILSSQ